MGRVDGKVAVVTGSTRGIGRAIAAMFAREGAQVVITGRHVERGAGVVAAIEAEGGEATFIPADISREEEVRALMDAAVARFGRLTTLVNNSAATDLVGPGRGDARVTELTNAAW